MDAERQALRQELRTPRSAAIAGIVFAVLLITALILLRLSIPTDPRKAATWLTDRGKRNALTVALALIPFAGIAFLWFIGVIRDRIGRYEDRFFATVLLGSGLLFVAMLFVAAAFAGGLIADVISRAQPEPPELWGLGRRVTTTLLNVYAMRMAAVFTISTATIAFRTRVMPRWIAFAGYAIAVVLLFGIGITPWVQLLFPAWILLVSIDTLVASFRRGRVERELTPGPDEAPA
jgi:hypothetical protein